MRIVNIAVAYEDGSDNDLELANLIAEYGISGYANKSENGLIGIMVRVGDAQAYNGPKHITL